MPTPRPAACGGAETRFQNELHRLFIGEFGVCVDQSQGQRLFSNQTHIDAGAVIRNDDHDFRAVAFQADGNPSDIRFAERRAAIWRFDAVDHRVAQHVLEGRHHALQHLAVQFSGSALHHQLCPFGGVIGSLAHQPGEPLHMALERHHARAHQRVLQFRDDARLLRQQILSLAGQCLE
jgi:hypothetical protein